MKFCCGVGVAPTGGEASQDPTAVQLSTHASATAAIRLTRGLLQPLKRAQPLCAHVLHDYERRGQLCQLLKSCSSWCYASTAHLSIAPEEERWPLEPPDRQRSG